MYFSSKNHVKTFEAFLADSTKVPIQQTTQMEEHITELQKLENEFQKLIVLSLIPRI